MKLAVGGIPDGIIRYRYNGFRNPFYNNDNVDGFLVKIYYSDKYEVCNGVVYGYNAIFLAPPKREFQKINRLDKYTYNSTR